MTRYIDADKYAERIKSSPAFKNMGFEGNLLQKVVLDLIDNAPTADVTEVVRCKDCKHSELLYLERIGEEPIGAHYCYYLKRYTNPTAFCSYGIRKED